MSVKFAIEKFMIRLYLRYFSYIIYFTTRLYVSTLRPRIYTPRTLLIIKPDAAGDYILMRNFLHSIRTSKRFEGYQITFLGNAVYRNLAMHFDEAEIDEFIWINKNRIYWNLPYYMRLAKQIFQRYEVTMQPVFSREFLFDYYASVSGVKERIGLTGDTININPAYKKIADRWYTNLIEVDPSELFEFNKNRGFFEEVLGESISLKAPYFTDEQMPDAGCQIPDAGLPDVTERFAVIFPGAQLGYRRWSTDKYAVICDYLYDRYQLNTLIVGGRDDARLASRIIRHATSGPTDVTGKTALHQLPGLFSKAFLIITNDTIAAHIGAAVDTPTIVLSQLNHYGRFVPYPGELANHHICIIPEKYQSFPKADLAYQFRDGSRVNINLINVEQVNQAIDHLLSSNPVFV